jgi:hypothetical protein
MGASKSGVSPSSMLPIFTKQKYFLIAAKIISFLGKEYSERDL